jgi:hypothetical protein
VIFVGSDQIYLSGPKSGPDKWSRPLVSLNLFKKLGENGAALSVESSMLPQISLLTGKLTGKMNKNSFHLTFKPQFLLGKDDHSSKINRELFCKYREKSW